MLRSLHIGKSKKIFEEIKYFLDGKGYNVEKSANEEEGGCVCSIGSTYL